MQRLNGVRVLAVAAVAGWAAIGTAGDGIIGIRSLSYISVQEINSGIGETASDVGYPVSRAEAQANGVGAVSRFAVSAVDGYSVLIDIDMQRNVAAGARPSVGFGTHPGTNRIEVLVLAGQDVRMDVAWSIAYEGEAFGMPNVQLWRDWAYLLEVCSSAQAPLAEGAWSTILPGQAGPQMVFLPVSGSSFASTTNVTATADRVRGWVRLTFAFPPSVPDVQGIVRSAAGLQLTLAGSSFGQTNRIEVCPDLATTNWTVLTNLVAGGVSTNTTVALPTGDPRGFYRTRLLP